MAEENETNEPSETEEKKPGMIGKLIVWGMIFVIGVGTGAVAPMLTDAAPDEKDEVNPAVVGVKLMDFPEPDDKIAFIEFEEVVANINDPRQSRYVTCALSLQVAKSQLEPLTLLIEEKNALLKNWLLAHLRDKTLDEVRGKYGHNLLRREVHGKFNEILFTDGIERIQDVLFRDFKTQ